MRPIVYSGVLICGLLALAAGVDAAPVPLPATRVMPLGDGITAGEGGQASYRGWLYQRLNDEGYGVDFVGSQHPAAGTGPRNDGSRHAVAGGVPAAPPQHEGHAGLTIDALAKDGPGWIKSARPQVVILVLGPQALTSGGDLEAALNKLILAGRADNPAMAFILAPVPAEGGGPGENSAKDASKAMAAVARRLSTMAAPVLTVDLSAPPHPVVWPGDGDRASQLMADRLFAALAVLLDRELPIAVHRPGGHLAALRNDLAISDYGGITAEGDELMMNENLTQAERSELLGLLDDIASYSQAQRRRAEKLIAERRICDAAPILLRLAGQFRGTPVGQEALDQLARWQKDARLSREMAAGQVLAQGRLAERGIKYGQAYGLYERVVAEFPGTMAAQEAQKLALDLKRRGLDH